MTMYPKSELKLEGEGSKQELVVTIRIDTKWLDAQFASELAGQLRNEATTMVDRWYRDNGRGDVQKIFRESFENASSLQAVQSLRNRSLHSGWSSLTM